MGVGGVFAEECHSMRRWVYLFIYMAVVYVTEVLPVVQKTAFEGENVTLPCTACMINTSYQWVVQDHNGTDVVVVICVSPKNCIYQHHLKDRAQIDTSSGDLTIYSTRLSDEGLYTETSSSSVRHTNVSLEIYVRPDVPTVTGPGGPVLSGAEVSFTCEVSRVKPAYANMMIWSLVGVGNLGPGETTVSQNSDKTFRVTSTLSHVFEKGTPTHIVQCMVTPQEGAGEPVTGHTQVTLHWPPTKSETMASNTSRDPIPGRSKTLSCSFSSGNPTGHTAVRWMKNSQLISTNHDNKYNGLSTTELTINSLESSDNGLYKCLVSNSAGEMSDEDATGYQLTVFSAHTSVDVFGSRRVVEGDRNVEFTCVASGGHPDQVIAVQWLTPARPEGRLSSDPELELQIVEKTDKGLYTCRVQNFNNPLGWASSAPHELDVQYPAFWTGTDMVAAALNQQNVVVNCSVSANPPPVSYEWTFNGGPLRSGIVDQPTGSITIDEVQMSDFANYSCAVSNGLEKDGMLLKPEFVIELKPEGPPGDPVELDTLPNTTSRSVTLQWQSSGFDGGYPPVTYIVEYKSNSGSENNFEAFNYEIQENKFFTVTVGQDEEHKLEPDQEYTFRVRAKNNHKEKAKQYSDYVETSGRTKATPKVELGEVTVSERVIKVTWIYDSNSRKKRENDLAEYEVGVAIDYKKHSESTYKRYPETGSVEAVERKLQVDGQFDIKSAYDVNLLVFEGGLGIASLTLDHKTEPETSSILPVVGGVIGGIVVAIVIILLVVFVVLPRWRRQQSTKSEKSNIEMKDGKDRGSLIDSQRTVERNGGLDNPALEDGTHDTVGSQAEPRAENAGTKVEPVYAEVNKGKKKKNKGPGGDPHALYAQPDKTKKNKKNAKKKKVPTATLR